jgi:uncharacterized protein YpuA (DUF1002 family)
MTKIVKLYTLTDNDTGITVVIGDDEIDAIYAELLANGSITEGEDDEDVTFLKAVMARGTRVNYPE